MSQAAIEVERLSKVFGGLRAVDEASLAVAARRAPRADRPERRRQDHAVQLHRRHAARRPPAACCCSARTSPTLAENRRTALGMGRTFQISNVFTDLTVFENLMLSIIGTEPAQVDHAPAGRRRSPRSARRRSTGSPRWASATAPTSW